MTVTRILSALLFVLISLPQAAAQFSISENKRFLLKENKPFFWLGDTAWELFHRLNIEEADQYLKRRSEQGFTVIQAVVLAEMDGLQEPNPYNERPFTANDPSQPNEKYFAHVDAIIDKANSYGLNIGLLPTWGDKVFKDRWGKGPEIFTVQNAGDYAGWLAKRYAGKTNLIWILGGDRNPRGAKDTAIWNAMGRAIKAANKKAIITFHPQPNELGSAEWFHQQPWLDFNMFQTGHCRDNGAYDKINTVYQLTPIKPVMDGEPIYEDHPVCFNAKDLGTSSAYDVRKAAYLHLFAGGFGHTYGCHDIWQMYSPKYEAVNGPHIYWTEALELPGAQQMKFVRTLMESYPLLERVPDQGLIVEKNTVAAERIQATRGKNYLFVYSATGKPFTLLLGKIAGTSIRARWFNPRDGKYSGEQIFANKGTKKFQPPSSGYGQDWILVADTK